MGAERKKAQDLKFSCIEHLATRASISYVRAAIITFMAFLITLTCHTSISDFAQVNWASHATSSVASRCTGRWIWYHDRS